MSKKSENSYYKNVRNSNTDKKLPVLVMKITYDNNKKTFSTSSGVTNLQWRRGNGNYKQNILKLDPYSRPKISPGFNFKKSFDVASIL